MSGSGFSERFARIVKEYGGQNAFARHSKLSQAGVARLVTGGEPSLSTLILIANATGKSLGWLVYGEESTIADMILIPLRDVTAAAGAGSINDVFEGEEAIVAQIPFLREIVRGWGRSPDKIEAIFAKGDSMFPTIKDGDIVLIHRADRTWLEGAVMALSSPDGLRLKRLQKAFDGSWLLVSDNKTLYDPEKLTSFDVEQIRTIGRAFWAGGMI